MLMLRSNFKPGLPSNDESFRLIAKETKFKLEMLSTSSGHTNGGKGSLQGRKILIKITSVPVDFQSCCLLDRQGSKGLGPTNGSVIF